jgi:hypothetical protein
MNNQGLYERRALSPNSNEGFTEDLLKDVVRLTGLADSVVRTEFDRCLASGLSATGALRVILADASGFGWPEAPSREQEPAGVEQPYTDSPPAGQSPLRMRATETSTVSGGAS